MQSHCSNRGEALAEVSAARMRVPRSQRKQLSSRRACNRNEMNNVPPFL
jgi:hypothetical protein